MKRFIFGGVSCAALFLGTAAAAQSGPVASAPPAAKHRSSFFTSNQNRGDLSAHVERQFKALDVNHDGFVTREEIASLQSRFDDRMAKSEPKRAGRMFDRLDANGDGRITQAEVESARAARAAARGKSVKARRTPSALFVRADSNKDGVVTRAEFDAALSAGRIKVRHANMRGSSIVRMFDAADTNKDGRLSLDEAQQASLRQFDAADLNRDGVLTPDERRHASKGRRKARLAS